MCAEQTRKPLPAPKIGPTYPIARIDASELSTTTSSLVISNSTLGGVRLVRGHVIHQIDAIILTSIDLRSPHTHVAQLLEPSKVTGRSIREAYTHTRE